MVRVRRGRSDDREALQSFYEAFEPKRAAQGLPPIGPDRIRRWLDGVLGEGIHLLALRGERLIGHSFLVPTGSGDVHEYAVFLAAAERGRGVGTGLNGAAIEAARHAGIRRLWLSAEPHNRAAIRSYEKVGFTFRPMTIYASELEMELELNE